MMLEVVSVSMLMPVGVFFSDGLGLPLSSQCGEPTYRNPALLLLVVVWKEGAGLSRAGSSAMRCSDFGFFPPLRFCSFTASPVSGNFKLLLTSRGLFCEDNVICPQHSRGIRGKTSWALPLAYSAAWFTLKGRRTGAERAYRGSFHIGM